MGLGVFEGFLGEILRPVVLMECGIPVARTRREGAKIWQDVVQLLEWYKNLTPSACL